MKKRLSTATAMFIAAASAIFLNSAEAHGTEDHGKKPASKKAISKDEHPWGREGDATLATRIVEVNMADTMRFTPDQLAIKQGETVKFVVKNSGKVLHEMVIGTEKELKAHAETMKKHPGMEHDEPYMAHVSPSKQGEIVWQFTRPGEFLFACLVPGHFEAGMVGKIVVTAANAAVASADMTEAEVRKVDKEQGKVTLKHGEIKSLDMPPMTMVFRVKDAALLDRIVLGDKIKFQAEKIDGAYTVTRVEKTN
jgi:uncharacterized cupredoxin-like copper-binding protein